MKITVFGTGNAGVTKCYNSCFLLEDKDFSLLVDAGGGNEIIAKLKKHNIKINQLKNIFVTHEHIDHLLGVLWIIRNINQEIDKGNFPGNFNIYCHEILADKITSICDMTIKNGTKYFGNRIIMHKLQDKEQKQIDSRTVTFFDINSTKAKQFGFSLIFADGKKFTCLGDEPYKEHEAKFLTNCDVLIHEAFCLYSEKEKYNPYKKSHTTVKEACETAERYKIPNLILYHTEEDNLENRKELYKKEGELYYNGNLLIPYDDEVLKF